MSVLALYSLLFEVCSDLGTDLILLCVREMMFFFSSEGDESTFQHFPWILQHTQLLDIFNRYTLILWFIVWLHSSSACTHDAYGTINTTLLP